MRMRDPGKANGRSKTRMSLKFIPNTPVKKVMGINIKDPELLMGKKPVALKDFKVGEHVLVGWKSTASGPVIERLIAG